MNTILRLPAVKACTGLGRSTIYLLISRGGFPRPIPLGARAVGWTSDSVEAWIAERIEQSRPPGRDTADAMQTTDAPTPMAVDRPQ
jgi:prophage regulatory protein